MKSLSAKTFQCGVTVQGLTTLSGTVYLTALTNTATWDYVVVGTTAQGQLYTRTYAQLMSDITSGIGLSGYVPTSRTLTINGVSYDLTANRSWTISTVDYTSRLQHVVKAGVAINKGQAVYVTSADGTNMIVGLASNASEATSSKTMGLLDATVSTNGFANVVTEGLLAGLDTSAAGTEGDPVWLGTGGNLIYGLANKPYAPAHLVFIGIVTRKNSNNGEIFVKVQNGFELNEIHDVDLKTNLPTAGQLLRYDSDGLWKNWSPNYLTAEVDTLATVTGRGATTNTSITVGPDLTVQADGGVNYTASRLWLNSHNNYRGAGVHMTGVGSTWFAGTPYTDFDGGYVIARTGTSNDHSSAQYSNALLTVKSSGNVGIGTTNPGAKLVSQISAPGYSVVGQHSSGGQVGIYNSTGDNGIGTVNNYAFNLFTNNSAPQVTLTTAGNVGIGITSPTEKLHVNGDTRIVGNTYVGGIINAYQGDASIWVPNLGQAFTIKQTTGNVGIGTTAPGFKIEVNGGATGNNIARFTTGGTGGGTRGLTVYSDNSQVKLQVTDNAGSQGTWAFLNLNPDGGNVGIGTTSPGWKLHVAGESYTSGVVRIGGTNPFYFEDYGGGWFMSDSTWVRTSNSKSVWVGGGLLGGDGGLTIGYGGTGSPSGGAIIAGNVGVGTSSPGFKLDVNGTARVNQGGVNGSGQALIVAGSGDVQLTDGGSLFFGSYDYGGSTYIRAFDDGNIMYFYLNGTNMAYFRNDRAYFNANVGIGTSSPTQILHVAGNIRVTGAFYDSNNQAGTSGQILKSTGSGTDWVSLSEITGVDGTGTANYVTKWSDADTITNSLIYDNGTNVGIGTTSPGYNFDVNGQVRVQDKLRVGTVNSGNGVVHMSSSATINPNTTTIVWAQNVSVGMCAFIEYYILNNNSLTDQRAGTIMVTWNQSGTPTIAHTETTTPDIGSTIAVNFTSSLVGSDARINAVNSSANPYTIVMSYKYF